MENRTIPLPLPLPPVSTVHGNRGSFATLSVTAHRERGEGEAKDNESNEMDEGIAIGSSISFSNPLKDIQSFGESVVDLDSLRAAVGMVIQNTLIENEIALGQKGFFDEEETRTSQIQIINASRVASRVAFESNPEYVMEYGSEYEKKSFENRRPKKVSCYDKSNASWNAMLDASKDAPEDIQIGIRKASEDAFKDFSRDASRDFALDSDYALEYAVKYASEYAKHALEYGKNIFENIEDVFWYASWYAAWFSVYQEMIAKEKGAIFREKRNSMTGSDIDTASLTTIDSHSSQVSEIKEDSSVSFSQGAISNQSIQSAQRPIRTFFQNLRKRIFGASCGGSDIDDGAVLRRAELDFARERIAVEYKRVDEVAEKFINWKKVSPVASEAREYAKIVINKKKKYFEALLVKEFKKTLAECGVVIENVRKADWAAKVKNDILSEAFWGGLDGTAEELKAAKLKAAAKAKTTAEIKAAAEAEKEKNSKNITNKAWSSIIDEAKKAKETGFYASCMEAAFSEIYWGSLNKKGVHFDFSQSSSDEKILLKEKLEDAIREVFAIVWPEAFQLECKRAERIDQIKNQAFKEADQVWENYIRPSQEVAKDTAYDHAQSLEWAARNAYNDAVRAEAIEAATSGCSRATEGAWAVMVETSAEAVVKIAKEKEELEKSMLRIMFLSVAPWTSPNSVDSIIANGSKRGALRDAAKLTMARLPDSEAAWINAVAQFDSTSHYDKNSWTQEYDLNKERANQVEPRVKAETAYQGAARRLERAVAIAEADYNAWKNTWPKGYQEAEAARALLYKNLEIAHLNLEKAEAEVEELPYTYVHVDKIFSKIGVWKKAYTAFVEDQAFCKKTLNIAEDELIAAREVVAKVFEVKSEWMAVTESFKEVINSRFQKAIAPDVFLNVFLKSYQKKEFISEEDRVAIKSKERQVNEVIREAWIEEISKISSSSSSSEPPHYQVVENATAVECWQVAYKEFIQAKKDLIKDEADKNALEKVLALNSELYFPSKEEREGFPNARVIEADEIDGPQSGQKIRRKILKTTFDPPLVRTEAVINTTTGSVVSRKEMAAGHLLLTLTGEETPEAFIQKLEPSLQSYKISIGEIFPSDHLYSLHFSPVTLASLSEVLEATKKLSPVICEPSYLSHLCGRPTYYDSHQWNMNGDYGINPPEKWKKRMLEGEDLPEGVSVDTVVAIIDTGIRHTHNDLTDKMWTETDKNNIPKRDVISGDYIYGCRPYATNASNNNASIKMRSVVHDAQTMDRYGHGTHCSGIIGAKGIGVAGVVWNVQLMACKAGESKNLLSENIAYCIRYACDHGAKVLNCSFGSRNFSTIELKALEYARDKQVIVVVSAGNDGENNDDTPHYPANYAKSNLNSNGLDNIVVVASSTQTGRLECYLDPILDNLEENEALASCASNYGSQSVHLAAPGVDIYSTGHNADVHYKDMTGTSMAAPHVAGALALMKAKFPRATYRDLIDRLFATTD